MIHEQPVPQVDDDAETAITTPPQPPSQLRSATHSEWPPAPPLPAEAEALAGVEVDDETTSHDAVPPGRHATVYAAVGRPQTETR